MKNATMISRRSFLKAAMAASAVSALAFTGCGGSASSTVAASSTASSAAASAAAEGGQTFKVGIVNYVDHASLNQIVESVESRLDAIGKEKGVTFDYADYYANAQADQSNLNQIGADLVADGVDVIVAVATPTAATMLAAVEKDLKERFADPEAENTWLFVAHSQNDEMAAEFAKEIEEHYPKAKPVYGAPLSLSIACHIGPGSLAVAMSRKIDAESERKRYGL